MDSTLWNQLGVDVEPAAQIELHIRILLLPTTSQQMPTVPELHNCTQQMSRSKLVKPLGATLHLVAFHIHLFKGIGFEDHTFFYSLPLQSQTHYYQFLGSIILSLTKVL